MTTYYDQKHLLFTFNIVFQLFTAFITK